MLGKKAPKQLLYDVQDALKTQYPPDGDKLPTLEQINNLVQELISSKKYDE